MNKCKQVCHRFAFKMGGQFRAIDVLNGRKWCRECQALFNIEDLRCPCCNQILRVKPRFERADRREAAEKLLMIKRI